MNRNIMKLVKKIETNIISEFKINLTGLINIKTKINKDNNLLTDLSNSEDIEVVDTFLTSIKGKIYNNRELIVDGDEL